MKDRSKIPNIPDFCKDSWDSSNGRNNCIASENYGPAEYSLRWNKWVREPKDLQCPYFKNVSAEFYDIESNADYVVGVCSLPVEPSGGIPVGIFLGGPLQLLASGDPKEQKKIKEYEEATKNQYEEKLREFLARKFGDKTSSSLPDN